MLNFKKDELFKLDMPFKEALDGFLKVKKDKNGSN